jgi:hypothetical protein
MKSFKDILTESQKTYEFKLGFAGEIPEGFEDRLQMILEKNIKNRLITHHTKQC